MSPDMSFCVDVVVRNLSEDGALINALAPVHMVPGRVYLWQARTRTLFECEVQWRKNDRLLGLRFTETSNRLSVLNLLESASALQSRPSAPSLPMRCAS